MLLLKGFAYKLYLIMSDSAPKLLTKNQVERLETHTILLTSSLDTIEACSGCSVRCMMAEIFLPKA